MDFVTGLPASGSDKFDSIFVVIDRATKMAHFVPCHKDITAERTANLLNEHVFRLHGVPTSIVSDRDPKFTSAVFQEFAAGLKIKQAMSTAFHPQSDGITERLNRTLEAMLRCYVQKDPKSWSEYLSHLEFAYNDSVQASTRCTPFALNYQYHPKAPIDLLTILRPKSRVSELELKKQAERVKKNISTAINRQKENYDTRRSDGSFEVGDQVLLSTKQLRFQNESRKLLPLFIGPFKVLNKFSDSVYRLDLPNTMRIHPVFNISRLVKFRSDETLHPFQMPPRAIIMADGEEEFHVEEILDTKGKGLSLRFLVKWTGFSHYHNTWEPYHVVQDLEALDTFFAKQPEKCILCAERKAKAVKRTADSNAAPAPTSDTTLGTSTPTSRSGRRIRAPKRP
jgi:hypothetical protein